MSEVDLDNANECRNCLKRVSKSIRQISKYLRFKPYLIPFYTKDLRSLREEEDELKRVINSCDKSEDWN